MNQKLKKDSLKSFITEWDKCNKCDLYQKRCNIVHYRGSLNSKIFVIGESPSEEEDKSGIVFNTKIGRKIDKIFENERININKQVFVTYLVPCRPPFDRMPKFEEIELCRKRLDELINIVMPKVILLLGMAAALRIAGVPSVVSWRGKCLNIEFNSQNGKKIFPAYVTYHPSYLFRDDNLDIQKKFTQDIRLIKRILNEK